MDLIRGKIVSEKGRGYMEGMWKVCGGYMEGIFLSLKPKPPGYEFRRIFPYTDAAGLPPGGYYEHAALVFKETFPAQPLFGYLDIIDRAGLFEPLSLRIFLVQ